MRLCEHRSCIIHRHSFCAHCRGKHIGQFDEKQGFAMPVGVTPEQRARAGGLVAVDQQVRKNVAVDSVEIDGLDPPPTR
jgi:hypothetical protein